MRTDHRSDLRAEAALVAVTAIWGATFVLVKLALASASTLLFLALRFSLAALALGLFLAGRLTGFPAPKRSIAAGCAAGVCLFLGYYLQTAGLRLTSPSKSAFLTALSVVMVPLLASIVYKNAPRIREAAGAIAAACGLALLTLEPGSLHLNRGDALTLGCAWAFAAHVVVVGHFATSVSIELLSLTQVAVTAALALATFWWAEPVHVRWTGSLLAALAVTGLLATALAFTVQTWAQSRTTATRTALILALEPVFAWITSALATGERLSRRSLLGAALILFGIVMNELKPGNRKIHQ